MLILSPFIPLPATEGGRIRVINLLKHLSPACHVTLLAPKTFNSTPRDEQIIRDMGVDVRVGRPRVSYRETVTTAGQAEGQLIKQTGGRGQYAVVVLRVEPFEPEPGQPNVQFVNALKGGVIDKQYIPAVKAGVHGAAQSGTLAGYPVINVKVTLLDGKQHEVDSSDVAFQEAASRAFHEAVRRAKPILLEPIMRLELTTPEEYYGAVQGSLLARRVSITHTDLKGNIRIIDGEAPLSEMFGYATELRGLTQGRASFVMEPKKYQPLPEPLMRKVIESAY